VNDEVIKNNVNNDKEKNKNLMKKIMIIIKIL